MCFEFVNKKKSHESIFIAANREQSSVISFQEKKGFYKNLVKPFIMQ